MNIFRSGTIAYAIRCSNESLQSGHYSDNSYKVKKEAGIVNIYCRLESPSLSSKLPLEPKAIDEGA